MFRRGLMVILAAALLLAGCAHKAEKNTDTVQSENDDKSVIQQTDDIEPPINQAEQLTPEADIDITGTEGNSETATVDVKPVIEENTVKLKEIILDGSLDDWAGITPSAKDPAGDAEKAGIDLETVYSAFDTQYLYIAVKVSGNRPVVNMKLDYNQDGKPEYGANCNSAIKKIFTFYFKSENKPEENGESDLVAFGDVLEYAVPLELIGNPKQITIEMWANQDIKNPQDYDFVDQTFNVTGYDTLLLKDSIEYTSAESTADAKEDSDTAKSDNSSSKSITADSKDSEKTTEYNTKGKTFTDNFADSDIKPMVSGGFNFSMILKSDGTVWGCGVNGGGQLGNGKKTTISTLTKVEGLSGVVKIDTADAYTLALRKDGTVWGWGNPYFNELGFGKQRECTYAAPIEEFSDDVCDIAAGDGFSFAVKDDGSVWYIGGYYDRTTAPKKMQGLSNIAAVASKHMVAMALTKDGKVWTWSWEYEGDGSEARSSLSKPVLVKGIDHVKLIEVGSFQYIVVKEDGTLWTWGGNTNGEIGDGTLNDRDNPAKVKGISDVVAIGSGAYFSMATLSDGSFWAWGDNRGGEFGNGSTKSSLKPVKIDNLSEVISMSGGVYHMVALKNNGDVVVMGYNGDGVLGVSDKKDKLTPYKIMNLKDKDNTRANQRIYPNGDLTDWGDIKPVAQGEAPEGSSAADGISELYAVRDDKNVYLAARLTKNTPLNLSFCLDLDGDGEKDYTLIYSTVDDTYLFRFKQKGNTGERLDDGYGVYGTVVETSVSLKDMGNPQNISVMAYVDHEDDREYKEVTTPYLIPYIE